MGIHPKDDRDTDDEPTEPIPGKRSARSPARPSFAPALSTRISDAPTTVVSPTQAKPRWLAAGGVLITLALAVVVTSRILTQIGRVPEVKIPVPIAVPDPDFAYVESAPEPAPDPRPEPATAVEPEPAIEAVGKAPTPTPTPSPDAEVLPIEETPPEHLAVIVHPDNPVTELSTEEIQRIYLEERRWADGSSAKPVGRYRAPALRKVFLELVLGTSHQAIKDHFEAKKEEGLERVRRLPTDEAVIELVSKRRDALGYVDWAKLSSEQRAQVKKVFEIRLK
jgi:hypothetical protein